MSSVIYISNSGDDFTPEQLELLHKYTDQARVWAHLFYKEAGFYPQPYKTTEEWREARGQWLAAKEKLKQLDPAYHNYIISTDPRDPGILIEPYILTQKDKKYDRVFDAADVDSPKFPTEQFGHSWARPLMSYEQWLEKHPTDRTPEQIKEVNDLTGQIHELLGRLYSRGTHIRTQAPRTTTEEQTSLLVDPQTGEEFQEYLKNTWKYDYTKAPRSESASLPTALHQMAAGFAASRQLPDPESFAQDVISRALMTYNPYYTEDTGTGRPAEFCNTCGEFTQDSTESHVDHELTQKPRKARFGTYLYRAMQNAFNSIKKKHVKEVSLSEGKGADDEGTTLEEKLSDTLEEKNKADEVDFSDPDLLLELDKYLEDKLEDPASKYTPESATRLKKIYQMFFVENMSYSDIARSLGLGKKAPNAQAIQKFITGYHPSSNPSISTQVGPHLFEFLRILPEEDFPAVHKFVEKWDKATKEKKEKRKKAILEDFLTSISQLRKEGTLNYNLLRNKIQQRLSSESPQLFTVYTYLYESDYSNPDTAKIMRLSPPRITGLKKKIVASLLELPEIDSILSEAEDAGVSPLRRLIYAKGDTVKVLSINETGTLVSINEEWYEVQLDNGNDVLTVKDDLQKHCTLIDSAQSVLNHYFNREVVTPQCYLSLISSASPKLIILELRPVSAEKTSARLHINNNLMDVTEITEQYPDNLVSILKGHIGVDAQVDTPFTALFEEVA